MRVAVSILAFTLLTASSLAAQTKPPTSTGAKPSAAKPTAKPTAKPPAKASPTPSSVPAAVTCPATLGAGVMTRRSFCDVLAAKDPSGGVIVAIPPHKGEATLVFSLHARHTYSEQLTAEHRAFAAYTAVVGVYTLEGTPLGRGVVQVEFRTKGDLFDRVSGGAGPNGVKAVAPIGQETVQIRVPEDVEKVSIVGDHLETTTLEATTRDTLPGRPVAVISNATVEYVQKPAAPPARKRTTR